MKVGDRVKVIMLQNDDISTSLMLGSLATISACGNRVEVKEHPLDIFFLTFDEEYLVRGVMIDTRWMFRQQMEVIEEAPC